MNVLLWHVHGSWMTNFVQGPHRYLVPVLPDRGPDGRGRAQTWTWPDSVVECTPAQLATVDVDVVIVQRPEDEVLAAAWLGRVPGRDVPLVWLEHNAPQGRIAEMRHPAADRQDLTLVHVTHTNALYWDAGATPIHVITHGVIDPGYRYTGEVAHTAIVLNEPERRGRVVGADLIDDIARIAPVDLFGMGADSFARDHPDIAGFDDLPQAALYEALARRRVYAHPVRWTSLGLSLIEAMLLGLPVVALATTEVPDVIPPGAGVVTNRIGHFHEAVRHFLNDAESARQVGKAGRVAALERFGLPRFLHDWDHLLQEVAA